MKLLLIISLLFFSTKAFSQRHFVDGVVKDRQTGDEMIGVHIRNLSSHKLEISDAYGKFRIPVQEEDTLLLTSVGHQRMGWIAEEKWFEQEAVEFLLPVDTIYLQEVEVGQLPPEGIFKEMIMDTRPEDTSFWYYGVPKPVMEEYTVLEKRDYFNPVFIATHPLSVLHHIFSKREKEKKKMQQIKKQQFVRSRVEREYNRKWYSKTTRLGGDRLTDFISYCNFSIEYLDKTPKYVVYKKIMALLDQFLSGKEPNS